jgi:hypothetical protein
MKREYNDSEEHEDDDIDYDGILGVGGGGSSSASVMMMMPDAVSLVPMELATGEDLNLTRGDFHNDEIFYAWKRAASFLAIALHVEHHEPLQRGDFCFGQEIAEDQLQEEAFFPPKTDGHVPRMHL